MTYYTTERIPVYALPYLINGDVTGLTDEDKETIDMWFQDNFPDGFGLTTHGEPYFSTYPAFGLPVEVQDTDIYIPD